MIMKIKFTMLLKRHEGGSRPRATPWLDWTLHVYIDSSKERLLTKQGKVIQRSDLLAKKVYFLFCVTTESFLQLNLSSCCNLHSLKFLFQVIYEIIFHSLRFSYPFSKVYRLTVKTGKS